MSFDLFEAAEALEKAHRVAEARSGRGSGSEGDLKSRDADWSVSEVTSAARDLVEGAFPTLRVAGEIANFTKARSGHCYFTLRDSNSQLRCVMWRDDAVRLPTAPVEGMAVRAVGRLTIYAARGDFQLTVGRLEAEGEGLWKLALERLRRKLEAEGLLDPRRKRPLPRYPAVVGVVTSPSGAVLHDIVNVIRRRAPWTRVVIAGCRVQGDGAARDVAGAIRRFGRSGVADVLIVGRGGGSVEDLWAFNEEIVARSIAECPIPVISAVGHETDITIADLVADMRAPTPSAAAEAAVPDRADLARALERDEWRLSQAVAGRLGRALQDVDRCADRLARAIRRSIDGHRDAIRAATRHLEAMSPLSALGRGFAVPTAMNGRILRSTSDFTAGRPFVLRLTDGVVPCVARPASPDPDPSNPEEGER